MLNKSIFKAYDIRGIVNTDLTPESINIIGKALGTASIELGEKDFVVGFDGRLSSPWIRDSLIAGIKSTGCFVVDIGMVPTPLTYFASYTTTAKSAVMITGSHNPAEYNGLKIILAGRVISGEDILKLYELAISGKFLSGCGNSTNIDIADNYIHRIVEDVKFDKKLKIVVDSGNGVAGILGPRLYQELGAEVIPIYCNIDGTFPNHHPDPSRLENLLDLIAKVKLEKADIGLAFDGDGDRLGVVDNLGNIIWADRQMMIYSKDILSRNKGAKIIFDVKCSANLPKYIEKYSGIPIMSRTGHSFIKEAIQKENALLGGEMSGHVFFKERWFGFDDALYSGARLLEIISKHSETSSEIFNKLPDSINTPEININFAEQGEQFEAMNKLLKTMNFTNCNISYIDGIRVDYPNGWGLVRASNTTPALVLRFEADDEKNLHSIKDKFKIWLDNNKINNDL